MTRASSRTEKQQHNQISCNVHSPTLEQLKNTTLTQYVQEVVFGAVTSCTNDTTTSKPRYAQGIAKIQFPAHFFHFLYDARDTTGRGPSWDALPLTFETPIQQHVRGMTGIYEYTHTDVRRSMTFTEFRQAADTYEKKLGVNSTKEETTTTDEERMNAIERRFWKRLSPTMPPPTYAADQPGTLFQVTCDHSDIADDYALSHLDSCLHLLNDIPGVTSPYLYGGMWGTVFCAHTEDMQLLSINYLHAGAPKLWYAVAEPDAARFQSLAEHYYDSGPCTEFLRHKRSLLSPAIIKKAGIQLYTTVQYPGQAVITFPGSFHFGFNTGFNIAEATNFAVPQWIPFGQAAKVCLCRPDSVRINMDKMKLLLELYEQEQQKHQSSENHHQYLSYREWRKQREQEQNNNEATSTTTALLQKPKRKRTRKKDLSEQQLKNEFWVELTGQQEIWHLAKPIGAPRKDLQLNTRVLCFLSISPEVDDTCFAGTVEQREGQHVRVHLDGLPRSRDMWMETTSPKLFLDGGRWQEEDLPALHYWRESDSKRTRAETT